MEFDLGVLIAIYVVAFISVVGSIFVIISISKFGHTCTSTQLVLYLHIGQILQDIAALPNVYTSNSIACKVAGFLHVYSGMSNIIVVSTMVVTYRHMFFEDSFNISKYMQKNCVYHAFLAPLITLLPFIFDAYGPMRDTYCSVKHTSGVSTTVWIYLTLVWCVVVACVMMLILIYTTVSVYVRDAEMSVKVMKSIGLYALTTLVFWIPRLLLEIFQEGSNFSVTIAFVLVYVAGGVYTFIFMREKEALKLFETTSRRENEMLNGEGGEGSSSGQGGLVYSWEFEEEFDERAAMSAATAAAGGGGDQDQKTMLVNPILSAEEENFR